MAQLAHTGADCTDFLWKLSAFLSFGSKSPWLYNIPDAHANSHDHIFSNLTLTHCMWTCFLLACHPRKFSWSYFQPAAYTMHRITFPFSMSSTQILMIIFSACCLHNARNYVSFYINTIYAAFPLKHLHLVYFGTICISCFCSQYLTSFYYATHTIYAAC